MSDWPKAIAVAWPVHIFCVGEIAGGNFWLFYLWRMLLR
jgi:hypothetical protein